MENYKSTDDVFHEAFLVGVLFYGIREDEAEITDQARMYLSKLGNKWIEYKSSAGTGREVLPGPYLLLNNQLRDVWRLVDDVKPHIHGHVAAPALPKLFHSLCYITYLRSKKNPLY